MVYYMQQMKEPDKDYGYPMDFRAYATRGIIWGQRKVFSRLPAWMTYHRPMSYSRDEQVSNGIIRDVIATGRPCFIGRFGSVEIDATLRGWDISKPSPKIVKLFRLFTGSSGPFWWDNSIKAGLLRTTGVFPADEDTLMRFSKRMLEDSRQLDVLGAWNAREQQLSKVFFPNAKGVLLGILTPFFCYRPWTSLLRGKRVLVVHPFDVTIKSQYARRKELFANDEILPEFQLITYKPVVSFLGLETPYRDWFEALDKMVSDISKIDFDIALLGCGAYGFSLAAFIKRDLGRQAVHIGGATQLLFGIRGGRWDTAKNSRVPSLYNQAWVRPGEAERPANFRHHEGGAYW